ncbi:hypothetical protein GYMLUDRAFT_158338 [Collybiopsis luxurians FD-317 M1]|nr:hypothetical protein GYMLUDRAFT_158338 [Collybiopsis luxurians FD-317 M1]
MIQEWHHLRSLKCSGVGYNGVDSNAAGVLAVKCPVCPHISINIPAKWFEDQSKM